MQKRKEQIIDYEGIVAVGEQQIKCSKQLTIDYMFYISPQNLLVKQLVKVWVKPHIRYKKLIKSYKGKALGGQCLTGNKVIIMGDIDCRIQYISTDQEGTLHTQERKIPFWADVVLPKWVDRSYELLIETVVDDAYSELIDAANIYVALSIVVAVQMA